MNHSYEIFSAKLLACSLCTCCSWWLEALPGRILVRLLILEAGAGMRLPLPSPRALDSDMTAVVLAVAVLTVFPEGKE